MGNSATPSSKTIQAQSSCNTRLAPVRSDGSKKAVKNVVQEFKVDSSLDIKEVNTDASIKRSFVRQNLVNFEEESDFSSEDGDLDTGLHKTDSNHPDDAPTVFNFEPSNTQKQQPEDVGAMEKRRRLLKLETFSFEHDQETGVPIKRLADLHNYRPQEICCTMTGASATIENVVPFLKPSIAQSSLLLRRQLQSITPLV